MLLQRSSRWLRGLRPLDLVTIASVVLVGAVAIGLNGGQARGATHLVLLSLTLVESSVALLFRRRHPLGALVGVLAVYTVFQLPSAMVLPVLVALFTVVVLRPVRVLALAALVTTAVAIGRPYVIGDATDLFPQQLPLLLGIWLTVGLGLYQRLHRDRVGVDADRPATGP